MKAGPHAGQSLERIRERKAAEERSEAGAVRWGYGGTKLPPALVREFAALLPGVGVGFFETKSDPEVGGEAATSFSIDGHTWQPVPEGITVTGSSRALVIQQFEVVEESLELADYEIATGSRMGTPAVDYFYTPTRKTRNDAAIMRRVPGRHARQISTRVVIKGVLTPPYAVHLR